MKNYYNEHDPKAAAWLRELIKAGEIPDGDVDESDIQNVKPDKLNEYTQCHFFAGIGGWSLALRLAGVPDTERIWTASLSCQPFSVAGRQLGQEDSRHLFPVFLKLVESCRPAIIFGEQVAAAEVLGGSGVKARRKAGPVWFDGVCDGLEAARYTIGASDIPAAGVGAPHMRQRLYWVAFSEIHRQSRQQGAWDRRAGIAHGSGLGITNSTRRLAGEHAAATTGHGSSIVSTGCAGVAQGDTSSEGFQRQRRLVEINDTQGREIEKRHSSETSAWGDFSLIPCRDEKSRRIESGTFPLVARLPKGMVYGSDTGVPINPQATAEARVMRLRGYGNAIVPPLAAEFIQAAYEAIAAQ